MRHISIPQGPVGITVLTFTVLSLLACLAIPFVGTLTASTLAMITIPVGAILCILCLWLRKGPALVACSVVGGLAPILLALLVMAFLQLAYIVTLGHWPPADFG